MGKAIIFCAPSGAGKTTIVNHLLSQDFNLAFSVSACTRGPRVNEIDGKDYYFLSVEAFQQKIVEKAFVEWEEVYKNNYYGTLKDEVERVWASGKHVIFDVDVKGGLNLKKYFKDQALAVFVQPPSIQELRIRLEKRGTESIVDIERRIEKAEFELALANRFDHTIVNTNLTTAFAEAETVVSAFLTP